MAKRKTKPIVAVVGRPNVGKSTLFNALAGENISIVKDTPGITRDRIYADIHWLDMTFTLIDTGGIEPDSKDVILSQMREQAEIAMETADVIIFLVDVKQGLVDADSKVADMLRRSHKPVVLVVNKVDSFQKYMADVYEFYNLGIGDPHPISAVNRLGIGDMLEAVTEYFDKEQAEEEEDDRTRVAIVGKPNVGKSSLINKLLGENRLIVSDIAGTTRDAVDTEITYNGKEYVFIDTAGLRRKNKIKEELERYMIVRTVSAVERAEVVVLMIDAEEGVTEQDAKIAGIAHERGKATIIVVNKWDAIEKDDKTIYKFTEKVRNTLSFMPYAELLFVSAKTGQRLPKLFETIDIVSENHAMRVATGVLNDVWENQPTPQLADGREQVFDSLSAYQMTSILEGVATRGSGARLRRLKKHLAGKTGTTNDSKEGWFVGFSPDLVVGTYIGFDEPRTLGRWETGASVALPVFYAFMEEALKDQPDIPFRIPAGIKLVRINYKTGKPAVPGDQVVITEALKPDFDFETAGQRIINGSSDNDNDGEDDRNDFKRFGNSADSENFQLGTQY